MERLRKLFEGDINQKILDVGTGTGSFVPMLQQIFPNFKEIIGIDTHLLALERAQGVFKDDRIKFINMDAEDMEFEDNSMDVVCISNTIHHLPNEGKVFSEMMRVLKPGGVFIINEMFCDNQSEKQMSHVYIHHLGGEIDTLLGVCHKKTYKREEIIEKANRLGLNIIEVFEYNTHEEQVENPEEEKEALGEAFKAMEMKIERINEEHEREKYRGHVEELRGRLYGVGLFGATELMIIGKKL